MTIEKYSLRAKGDKFVATFYDNTEISTRASEFATQAEAISFLQDFGASSEDISRALDSLKPIPA